MNTIPDSVSFSQLCSFLKAKVSQDDFAQEVALDWEDRLSAVSYTHLTLPTICSV